MNMQYVVVLLMVLTSESSDPSVTYSAYFHIRRDHAFRTVNSCLPTLNSLPVISFHQCQIACLTNRQCRTATFHPNIYQCDLFSTRLEDGRLTPTHSAIVISLIRRHPPMNAANEPILTQIISPDNEIFGIWNTSVGQDSTPIQENDYHQGYSPPNQGVDKAIDNDLFSKHVSFGSGWNNYKTTFAGLNTGFYVQPSRPSILTHICWGTSSESNEAARDPMLITIEGSNETSSSNLVRGSSWSLIYNGSSGLENHNHFSSYKLVSLSKHSNAFRNYRLLVAKKRAEEDSVQYSEVQLYGYIPDE